MSEPTCGARIRPFPDDREIACQKANGHHFMHAGSLHDYAYRGSVTTISWGYDDRRSFNGPWPGPCPLSRCVLPAGHPRGHHVE